MNRRSFILGLLLAPFLRLFKRKPDPRYIARVANIDTRDLDQTSIWLTSWYHPPDYASVAGPHPTYAQWRDSVDKPKQFPIRLSLAKNMEEYDVR